MPGPRVGELQELRRKRENVLERSKSCATIQGFADRGEGDLRVEALGSGL